MDRLYNLISIMNFLESCVDNTTDCKVVFRKGAIDIFIPTDAWGCRMCEEDAPKYLPSFGMTLYSEHDKTHWVIYQD